MKKYDLHMSVERITVSLETDLAAAVREAADADAQMCRRGWPMRLGDSSLAGSSRGGCGVGGGAWRIR